MRFLFILICLGVSFLSNSYALETQTFVVEDFSRVERARLADQGSSKEKSPLEDMGFNLFPYDTPPVIGDEDLRYVIVPGDVLKISFFDKDQKQSASYQVTGQGVVHMPLAGPVPVAGYSRSGAVDQITRRLQEYIRDPRVGIDINSSGRVMLVGQVNRPGAISMSKGMTVFEGMMAVGGYSPKTARLDSVVIFRGPVDRPTVMRLDLKKMLNKGDRSDNVILKPGDLVYVPRTWISSLDNFVSTVYSKVLIWYGFGGQDIIQRGRPFFGPFDFEDN